VAPELVPLLGPERLKDAFEAVAEAEAWPASWLVVQDLARPYDLLLTLELGEDEEVMEPVAVFTAPRREWTSAREAELALQELRGDRLPRRIRNLVTVEYSMKTVTTYVYDVKPVPPEDRGLMALLPPGTLLRAAKAVDLGDGIRHTLALVIQEATFVPSACVSCESRLFGHADSGKISLVLAQDKAIESTLDLTPHLQGIDGKALLPRFACEPGDEKGSFQDLPLKDRFGDRDQVAVLDLRDLDGDARPLELTLPAKFLDCGLPQNLVVAVDPESRTLALSSKN
jgi:hypothetical protein